MLPAGGGRNLDLSHWKHRMAVSPIQDVVVPVLAAVAERRDSLTTSADGEQHSCHRAVIVPEIVVRLLEIPAHLAGGEVESDRRRRIQIVALAVDSVDVRGGVASAEVDEAQLRIDRGTKHSWSVLGAAAVTVIVVCTWILPRL